ncbi:MAG TPA: serine/threonine-protein kinase [Myxococcaceae bacterium]|nr:serine/threonine-protein kinase [Myxococcaceae bacterium]
MSGAPGSAARVFGNYEILTLLGRGGMAEVFRARVLSGPRAGREVALKRILPTLAKDPVYVDQFTSEADVSRLLEHPNVVHVLEVGVLDDVYFMVMDLVDGRDLGQILRKCRHTSLHLPVDFSVFLAKALLDALAYAHEACGQDGRPLEIVHCDVSPSNLFISRTGEIKLGDFGVSRTCIGGGVLAALHAKPYYVSPELLDGNVTRDADLWSATVTLYELLTLERPFTGHTPDEVFEAVRARRYVPPSERRPEIPVALDAIVAKGFAARPEDRFRSAREYGAALAPLFDERVGNPMAIAAVVRGLFGAGTAPNGS